MRPQERTLFSIAVLALVVFNFLQIPKASALTPQPPWWSGTVCDSANYPGSTPFMDSYDGLQACKPYNSYHVVRFFPGAWGEQEWQCTELVKRYMHLKYGTPAYGADGSQVVSNCPNGTGVYYLEKVTNNGLRKPSPGDVVSVYSTTSAGHTAIITEVSTDASGNGMVKVYEQNWDDGDNSAYRTITVFNNILGGDVTGWLHDPNSGRTPTNLLQVENAGIGWQIYNITAAASNQQISGKPGVLWPSSSQPNIFVSDPAGALRQFTTCSSGWCNYKITGDNALSGGLDAVQSSSGIEVFAPSTDGSLLQIEFNGSAWNIYNLTSALGGLRIKGPPGVFWESGGQPNIFAVDEFGALRQITPCTSGWCSYILSSPNTYSSGANAMKNGSVIEVVVRSTGGHLYQVENSGSGWTTFDMSIATGNVNITGTPALYATGSTMHLYASDFNYALRQFALCPTSGWCTYELTSYNAVSDGADAVLRTNAIEVFSASR